MRKLLIAISCLALSLSVKAATINAASANQTDVQAAIDSAATGDRVLVPTGNVTWTNLNLNKCITLEGNGSTGANRTQINRPADATAYSYNAMIYLVLANPDAAVTRITGFDFEYPSYRALSSSNWGIAVRGNGVRRLRIDNCIFKFMNPPLDVFCGQPLYGVIDHNIFIDNRVISRVGETFETHGADSWQRPVAPGGSDSLFWETNEFRYDAAQPEEVGEGFYGIGGGRAVVRYNTWNSAGMAYPAHGFDAHGYAGWGHGTRLYEIYNNTLNVPGNSYRISNLRGGIHIVHDNIINKTGSTIGWQLTSELAQSRSSIRSASGYDEAIHDSFFWNNTCNGVSSNAYVTGQWANEPTLGTEFFNRPIQSGDAWYPYKPYTYPHPLVGLVPAPATMHVVGQVTFPSGEQVTLDTTATKQ